MTVPIALAVVALALTALAGFAAGFECARWLATGVIESQDAMLQRQREKIREMESQSPRKPEATQ